MRLFEAAAAAAARSPRRRSAARSAYDEYYEVPVPPRPAPVLMPATLLEEALAQLPLSDVERGAAARAAGAARGGGPGLPSWVSRLVQLRALAKAQVPLTWAGLDDVLPPGFNPNRGGVPGADDAPRPPPSHGVVDLVGTESPWHAAADGAPLATCPLFPPTPTAPMSLVVQASQWAHLLGFDGVWARTGIRGADALAAAVCDRLCVGPRGALDLDRTLVRMLAKVDGMPAMVSVVAGGVLPPPTRPLPRHLLCAPVPPPPPARPVRRRVARWPHAPDPVTGAVVARMALPPRAHGSGGGGDGGMHNRMVGDGGGEEDDGGGAGVLVRAAAETPFRGFLFGPACGLSAGEIAGGLLSDGVALTVFVPGLGNALFACAMPAPLLRVLGTLLGDASLTAPAARGELISALVGALRVVRFGRGAAVGLFQRPMAPLLDAAAAAAGVAAAAAAAARVRLLTAGVAARAASAAARVRDAPVIGSTAHLERRALLAYHAAFDLRVRCVRERNSPWLYVHIAAWRGMWAAERNSAAVRPFLTASRAALNDVARSFARFDADASGTMDASELQAFLFELGHSYSRGEVQAMVEELDTDHSGDISLQEFAVWWLCGEHAAAARGPVTLQMLNASLRMKRGVRDAVVFVDEKRNPPTPEQLERRRARGSYASRAAAATGGARPLVVHRYPAVADSGGGGGGGDGDDDGGVIDVDALREGAGAVEELPVPTDAAAEGSGK